MRSPRRPRGFAAWRWELLRTVSGRVLEIGCGRGHNFGHYPAGARVTAFDREPARVRAAARRRAPVRLAVADAEALPWPGAAFDAVLGTLVFCSIPHPERALAEARRVLKPGGRLYLVEHIRSGQPGLARWQDRLAPAWLRLSGGCHLNRDTAEAVRGAGFTIEREQRAYRGVLLLVVARPA
jgi:ubiquinone/menaquinone biosynthesis C-methylase UbiE